MHHLSLVYALLISATGAIPFEDSPFPGAIKWTPNHQIQPGDVIVPVKSVYFVDWDVQMSPVVCAVGDMDISVSSGYSVANTVGGSAGVDLTFVKDKLAGSLGINYSRTWTTQTSVITKATIKDGQCGVMITKPLTTRRSGRQFRGCIGSATEVGTWYADSRGEGSYNGITWIEGAISACAKPGSNPPLSRCNGQGNFR
uniref:Uncharacterized protein n=1 Tax=Fusarium oxysporum (strain Fo5176) TaxID=660025 RepID=A0A0D2XF74_FUSOF